MVSHKKFSSLSSAVEEPPSKRLKLSDSAEGPISADVNISADIGSISGDPVEVASVPVSVV